MWSVGAGVAARAVGLVGTLFMTRLLAPDVVGEVAAAVVLAQTANWVSHWGFNQYMVVHGVSSPEKTYHVAVLHVAFGLVGLTAVAAAGSILGPFFHAPHLSRFLPGLALAVLIRRIGAVADKVLARERRFRELAIANGVGELTFTLSAVAMAATTTLGGLAIVFGNILQSCVATALILRATGLGWFQPSPWRWSRVREIVRFGLPLGFAHLFNFGTRYWDNLAFGRYFGPTVLGYYNMAYNLADVPATQVGEQLIGVLFPAMSQARAEDRKALMLRSTALMALTVFPLATGLGAIAPTLVALLLNERWQGVAPFLTVLAVLSVVRPLSWSATTYLSSFSRTREIMALEALKIVLLFAFIVVFSSAGPLWTAAAVGMAFGLQALATAAVVIVTDGIPAARLAAATARPLLACGVMVAAVIATRQAMLGVGLTSTAALLGIEVVAGVVAYVPAALLLAPATSRDFLQLCRRAVKA
jgi:lipopolysaccharide exporter